MKEVQCAEDLGIADCDMVARGEAPGEIAGQIVEHLRQAHDMNMPDVSAIMSGGIEEADVDEEVWSVVTRLREALDVDDVDALTEKPPGEEGPPPVSPEPV